MFPIQDFYKSLVCSNEKNNGKLQRCLPESKVTLLLLKAWWWISKAEAVYNVSINFHNYRTDNPWKKKKNKKSTLCVLSLFPDTRYSHFSRCWEVKIKIKVALKRACQAQISNTKQLCGLQCRTLFQHHGELRHHQGQREVNIEKATPAVPNQTNDSLARQFLPFKIRWSILSVTG